MASSRRRSTAESCAGSWPTSIAEKLEAYGLSLIDVQAALRKQNVLIPAGSVSRSVNRILQIFTNAIPEQDRRIEQYADPRRQRCAGADERRR